MLLEFWPYALRGCRPDETIGRHRVGGERCPLVDSGRWRQPEPNREAERAAPARLTLDADLTAGWRLAREAARLMVPRGDGRVVFVSSIMGQVARPGITGYVAAKAGLKSDLITAVSEGRRPEHMAEDEEVLHDFCIELQDNQSVSDRT